MEPAAFNKIKQNSVMYFVLKLIAFIIIVVILDLSIGKIFKYYYFKQNSGFLYRTTYTMDQATADILIFGSSKANHQYHPEVFKNSLKMTYYNAGRDGSSIFYHYALLTSVLKRYSPKIIVLDVSREFEKKQESYDRISMLLPYYADHPEIHPIIRLKSKYEEYKLFSKIYPYNSLLFSIIVGNSQFNKDRFQDIDGYVPLSRIWNKPIETYEKKPEIELDSTKIAYYEKFIEECLDAKVKLYIVSSPDFFKLNYIEQSNYVAKTIAKKYNLDFFDYSGDTLFLNNSEYFADISHLNDEGARKFSNLIINDIENAKLSKK